MNFKSRRHFIEYAMETFGKPQPKMQVDRIQNDGHYEPGNLRLVSNAENSLNKRTNTFMFFNGMQVPRKHVYHVVRTLYPEILLGEKTIQLLATRDKKNPAEIREYYFGLPTSIRNRRMTLPTVKKEIASLYLTD